MQAPFFNGVVHDYKAQLLSDRPSYFALIRRCSESIVWQEVRTADQYSGTRTHGCRLPTIFVPQGP